MQRRLHDQRRARQSLLLDLGALVYELHRQGKRAPDLLQRKAAQLTVVDDKIRELEAGLVGAESTQPEEPHPDDAFPEDEHEDIEDPPPDSETEEVDAIEPEPALANHEESHR
jgi:hypothetical protein